jgi:hypothetical protein
MKTANIINVIAFLLINQTAFSQLRIESNGNVGIGTNNPTHRLQVYGEGHIDSYTSDYGKAFWTKVHSKSACSYNLWNTYYNKDVFFVCGEGYLWTMKGGYFGSDSIMKEDIQTINSALNTIKALHGVRYKYKEEKPDDYFSRHQVDNAEDTNSVSEYRLGLVAQEVERIVPEVVKTMPDSTKAIAYTDLIALLIEGIKEQQIQIETLQAIVYSQEQEIVLIHTSIDDYCLNNDSQSKLKSSAIDDYTKSMAETSESAILFNNVPNPFSTNTEISFSIPENSSSARLIIHDMQGIELKSFEINQKGIGSIILSSSELSAGMYLYTLLVDKNIIDTKRMLLTNE